GGGGRARRRVRGAGCCAPGSPLSPPWRVEEAEAVLGALRSPSSPSGHLPRLSRAARFLRRKTVPARVSGCGAVLTPQDSWEPGGGPAGGVGGDRGGSSRVARGRRPAPPPLGWPSPSGPGAGRGRTGSSGVCQALQVAGSQAGRGGGAVTRRRQQLVGFSRLGLPVAEGAGFRAAEASRRRLSGRGPCGVADMARGQQKIQSQQKNAKKQAGQKKKQGHDQKAAAKAALIYTCTVCRTQMPDPKTFKQHFESKHPKTPLPPELADVQA
uniref:Zinc finger protein 706 n=1 Tax=Monodon monoceros TaxID=40151 RepID=A0A8C6BKH5_MONMO